MMQTLDLTLPSPAENLALDEALLLEAEDGAVGEMLRFWTSATPFVVVGIGGKVEQEVHLSACEARGIRVLRRCSGGGTVVQGPGCLNYSLILPIKEGGPLTSIHATNQQVMARNATALSQLVRGKVTVEGHTDLAIERIKVSGNAQRRLRNHLLFHGTFLLDFDLSLITELLPTPVLQPDYRRDRSHGGFLGNLEIDADDLKSALAHTWEATARTKGAPDKRVAQLVNERYVRREWNFRR